MNERDRIYLQILHFGLLSMRNSAALGEVEYCAVESEHLHNIPSLVGETNQARHDYYLDAERPCYLESVDRSISGIDFTLRRYKELWKALEDLRRA